MHVHSVIDAVVQKEGRDSEARESTYLNDL